MRPIVLTTLLTLVLVGEVSAQPVISLSSTDLAGPIYLGDTVAVDVILSGLSAGDTLELLAAEVVFDNLHFGSPNVTSGEIIPDVAGFVSDELTDLVGATFESLDTVSTTDRIVANGIFFSFGFSALSIGSGQISLGFADALGEDSLSNLIDGAMTGVSSSYSIFNSGDYDLDGDVDGTDFLTWQRGQSPNPLTPSDLTTWETNFGLLAPSMATLAAVPEPSTWLMVSALVVITLVHRWGRSTSIGMARMK